MNSGLKQISDDLVATSERNLVSQKSEIFDLTSLLNTALDSWEFWEVLEGNSNCAQSNRIRMNHDLELSGSIERIFVAIFGPKIIRFAF